MRSRDAASQDVAPYILKCSYFWTCPQRGDTCHTQTNLPRERATVREHAASVYVERHVCAINSPSATESRVFKFNQTRRPKLTAAQATMKWPKYIQHVVSHRYTERDTDTICSYRQRSIRTALACCTDPEAILLFDPLSFPLSPSPKRGRCLSPCRCHLHQ